MTEPHDPDRLLAETPPSEVLGAWPATVGPDGGSVLRALGAAPPVRLREPEGEDPVRTLPDSAGVPRAGLGNRTATARLQVHAEIARGGMGAVLRGRDTDLGRDVAIKVMLEAHAGWPELLRRF